MLTPVMYHIGAMGVPSTDAQIVPLPWSRYEHTITARGGSESASLTLPLRNIEEADWFFQQLLAPMHVYGPDLQLLWTGYLTRVELRVGGKARSRGLDSMANRITVRYTDTNGQPGATAASNSADSQARYGVKLATIDLNHAGSAGPGQVQAAVLAARAWPEFEPTTTMDDGEGAATPELRLVCAGWYTTLGWLTTSNTTKATAVTTTQVQTLLTSYAATNAWINSDYGRIVASGISDTQYIAADTTYLQAIERLLNQGNGTNRYMWGIDENRRFYAQAWAGATPSTLTYYGRLGTNGIFNESGGKLLPYEVKPDGMYGEYNMLDRLESTAQVASASRHYVERVRYSMERSGAWQLTLEGPATDDVTAIIARLGGAA